MITTTTKQQRQHTTPTNTKPEGKKRLELLARSDGGGGPISGVLSTDLQEGTVAFMPPKMTHAAWSALTANPAAAAAAATGTPGTAATGLAKVRDVKVAPVVRRRGPPPKWRTTVIVWISLMFTVMPWNYWVAPWLIKDLKVPLFWYVIIILIPVVVALKWFLLPCLDRLFAYCIYDIPRCPAVEPCLTLQIGCPCFRPDKQQPNKELHETFERVQKLEMQLQSSRDFNGVVRRRMLERIDRLEFHCAALLEEGRGGGGGGGGGATGDAVRLEDVDLGADDGIDETAALLAAGQSKDEAETQEVGAAKTDGGAAASNDQMVTACIRYNVRPQCFVLFEEWIQEISRTAANRMKGHRGTLVIRTPESSKEKHKTPSTHVLIYAFNTRQHMDKWHRDPVRKRLVQRMMQLLVRDDSADVRVYDSCKSGFFVGGLAGPVWLFCSMRVCFFFPPFLLCRLFFFFLFLLTADHNSCYRTPKRAIRVYCCPPPHPTPFFHFPPKSPTWPTHGTTRKTGFTQTKTTLKRRAPPPQSTGATRRTGKCSSLSPSRTCPSSSR
jgi:antibiotic biosynthesis monooxygenase (ABM) superfamily enzyme